MTQSSRRRTLALASAASIALFTLAACSSGAAAGGSSSAPITLTETDYYTGAPQTGQIAGVLNACGAQAGVKIEREQVPRVAVGIGSAATKD